MTKSKTVSLVKILALISMALAGFIIGCAENNESGSNQLNSTQQMVELLREINEKPDPDFNYYLSSIRADNLRKQIATATPRQRGSLMFSLFQELINSGKNEEAISEIYGLIDMLDLKLDKLDKNSKLIFEMLALAYMRKGELDNCLANHNSSSCILPLATPGVHQITEGSSRAIEIYEKILDFTPEDYNSRWLLNIAYITLGKYPDDIPKKWLIEGMSNNPDLVVPFKNISTGMEIGVNALSGGTCVDDFNNDGLIDIIASSWGQDHQIRYFINDGKGGFDDQTIKAGLEGLFGGLNLIHADFDNDGFLDVFVLRGAWLGEAGKHPNSLLRNDGNGSFEDVTISSGLLSFHPTQTAAWGDFNNDGWIDLFIANETSEEKTGNHPCELYLNLKNGTFRNIAAEAEVDVEGFFKGSTVGDINNDGLMDIYISDYNGPNILFLNKGNKGGVPYFDNIAKSAGVTEPMNGFPTWFWDYNNDGWLDIFASCYDHNHLDKVAQDEAIQMLNLSGEVQHPKLYKNNGDNTFSDVTAIAGLNRVMFPMGSNYGDIDNDGNLDFYLGTGTPDLRSLVPNLMFQNINGETFKDITYSSGTAHIQKGHGVGFADFDNDGDQDLYAVMGGAYEGDIYFNSFYINNNPAKSWVTINLEGVLTNRSAIGSRVRVNTTDESGVIRNIYHQVSTGGSFGSSSLQLEIGLGEAIKINEIEIKWANREQTRQYYKNIPINNFYLAKQGSKTLTKIDKEKIFYNQEKEAQHHHH